MHVISKAALTAFWSSRRGVERAETQRVLTEWYRVVRAAQWSNFAEIKATFHTADWVGRGKVVFDVGGNKLRVVGLIGFKSKRVFLLFVGAHADYDSIDVDAL